jgi:nitrite reductase/ring-hydroxylating ferredoxin subunit
MSSAADSPAAFDEPVDVTEASSDMAEAGWKNLVGIYPATASFPIAARLDEEAIWVFRTKDGFRGVQETCPHQRVMLGTAKLISNDTMVRCALHGFTFRLADGSGVNCRGFSIKVFEVREEAGALLARGPCRADLDRPEFKARPDRGK